MDTSCLEFLRRKIRTFVRIFAAVVFFAFAPELFAGISTPTADIVVTNLRIGQTYNLTEIANMPFQVRAMGIERRIKIELLKPATNQTRPGFEPIPDTMWLNLPRTDFLLLPGETGTTDIILQIPSDESLLGKKFEVFIWARTVPKDPTEAGAIGFGLGVRGSLRFTIAPRPPTKEELEKFAKSRFKAINLSLLPNDLFVDDIPLGRRVDVERQTGKFLRIVNVAEEPIKIKLKCVPSTETGLVIPEGWEAEPNTTYLRFPQETLTIRPLEVRKINFSLNFPGDEKYRNKKYLFIVEAAIEGELVRTTYRSKVWATIK